MSNHRLRLGTRSSALARWQADWVCSQLTELGVEVEIVLITTDGDTDQRPIGAIGGDGLFTKRIQRALLENQIDLAVHSLKDLPTEAVPGLQLAAVPPRESPFDAIIAANGLRFEQLPQQARIGTGSQRRRSQLLSHRPDLVVVGIRGNVDTRLEKVDSGECDAIVLAEAGLRRLGLNSRITEVLPPSLMLPAIGQGALGLECRADDAPVIQVLENLDDVDTNSSVQAERELLAILQGGCSAPIGAWGRVADGQLHLDATVLSLDGQQQLRSQATGEPGSAKELATQVAQSLLEQGAGALVDAART